MRWPDVPAMFMFRDPDGNLLYVVEDMVRTEQTTGTLKRFAVLVKSNADVEAGAMPTEQELAAMTRFNDELVESGAMLAGEGFLASADGARLTYDDRGVNVQRGPFRDPESLVAGYWMIQAASLDAAIDLMKKAPMGGGRWRSGRSPAPRTSASSSRPSCASARNGSGPGWRRTPGAGPPERIARPRRDERRQTMAERDGYIPGVPCWVDTSQPDPEAAVSLLPRPVRLGVRGHHAARFARAGTSSRGCAAATWPPSDRPPREPRPQPHGTPTSGSRAPTRPPPRSGRPAAGS